jgi:hypothetical protein
MLLAPVVVVLHFVHLHHSILSPCHICLGSWVGGVIASGSKVRTQINSKKEHSPRLYNQQLDLYIEQPPQIEERLAESYWGQSMMVDGQQWDAFRFIE